MQNDTLVMYWGGGKQGEVKTNSTTRVEQIKLTGHHLLSMMPTRGLNGKLKSRKICCRFYYWKVFPVRKLECMHC